MHKYTLQGVTEGCLFVMVLCKQDQRPFHGIHQVQSCSITQWIQIVFEVVFLFPQHLCFFNRFIDKKNHTSHIGRLPQFHLLNRAATRRMTVKTSVLSEFCEIEQGGGNGGRPVMLPPLWWSCTPNIYHGDPLKLKKVSCR